MLGIIKAISIPLSAFIFTILIFWLAPADSGWRWLLIITIPTVLLGIYDWLQPRWNITRNYPVAGRIRWLFYKLRPYLRAYIVEDDLHGTPFSFDARNLVHARARGQTDTQPFGTERDTSESTYHWLSHSIAPAQHPDKSPRVEVGNEQTGQPYSASVLNVSAMSFGSLSANAIEALNLGAQQGGFYHDTGEGGVSPYHLKHGGDLVWELGSGYFGARDKNGHFDPAAFQDRSAHDAIKMTEIKLSQGAKPGHGGMLPAAKVTEEIAKIRLVPAHQDCLSPAGHSAFATPVEMLEFAAQMRDLSGGKPVGLKLCIGQPHEVFALVKAIKKTGILPEFIVVDGGEGGTGAAPLEMSDWVGMPLFDGLILMRNALVGTGLKKHIRLVASGKVYSGMGLAQNLAIGADWCNAARAFMMSVGCIQAQRCHSGSCPTGVATQSAWRQRGLMPEIKAEQAARFHEKTLASFAHMLGAAGLEHPSQLRPHHLVHRLGTIHAEPMDQVYPFLPENILWDEPESTLYADSWRAADPDSFAPAVQLTPRREQGNYPWASPSLGCSRKA